MYHREARGVVVARRPSPLSQELDKYSAALAGTHFLRQERDRVIKDTMNPIAHLYLRVSAEKPSYGHFVWRSRSWEASSESATMESPLTRGDVKSRSACRAPRG